MNKETTSELLQRMVAERANGTLEEPLSALISESESRDVHEIFKNLDLQSIEEDILKSKKPVEVSESWLINLNHCDYATIVEGLNSNSTVIKIKTLEKLLSSQIIDTKQNLWEELAQSLRKCFVSTSNDVFVRSLKIHHRLIAFPGTICDGYLNLLKSTLLLLNSRYFNDLHKNRICQSLQLVLATQTSVLKFLLHANRTLINDTVTAFTTIVAFKSVFELIGTLDPKHHWLKNLCYGSYIRNCFFNTLKEQNSDFIKHIITTFTKKLNTSEDVLSYAYFLLYFWQYKNNVDFLGSEISTESTLEATLTKFNQRKKLELADLITDLFSHNPYLLTPKLLDVLVEPLSVINRSNMRNSIETHKYIISIVTLIANSPNFKILFGVCGSLKKGRSRQITRNYTNLPQKIIDISVTLLKMNPLNTETVILLLDCCASIYKSHPVSFIQVNPTKFLQHLHEFYRLNWKNDVMIKGALLSIFEFLYAWYGPTVRILGCDNEILVDLLTFSMRSGAIRTGSSLLRLTATASSELTWRKFDLKTWTIPS